MASIIDSFRELFDWLVGMLWPFRIVHQHEQGIRYFLGRLTKTLHYNDGILGTGLHAFWPFFGEIDTDEANLRFTELAWLDAVLGDGTEIHYTLSIPWRIKDLGLYSIKLLEAGDTVDQCARAACGEAAATFEDMPALVDGMVEEATTRLKKKTHGWGLDVAPGEHGTASLTAWSKGPTLRLLTDATE